MKHLKKIAAALLALLIITGICACKTAEHIIAEEIISQNETVSVPDEDNISTDENTENGELRLLNSGTRSFIRPTVRIESNM